MTEPKTIDRLKDLLFDREAREIGALQDRIDHIYSRTGDDERLQESVARVIDGALRDAEIERHGELKASLAPVVVQTVRSELETPEAQETLSKSLYPKLGKMVRDYVASAVRDMMEDINRRLESTLSSNRLYLRLQSIATGRSMAELALAETQRLVVEELYLVRRGSGDLLGHWSTSEPGLAPPDQGAGAGSNRDTLISGFLTAITAFAEEAFDAERSSIRSLDLDNHRIYIRASAAHLLAAKCSGSAAAAVEQSLDAALLAILEANNSLDANASTGSTTLQLRADRDRILHDASVDLEAHVRDREAQVRKSRAGVAPLKLLAWVVGLPLALLLVWQIYVSAITYWEQSKVDRAIEALPELAGYPITAKVERGGGVLTVAGLTPTADVRDRLLADLHTAAQGSRITANLGVLPKPDVTGVVRASAERRAVYSAIGRLNAAAISLQDTAKRLDKPDARDAIQARADTVRALIGDLDTAVDATSAERLPDLLTSALRILDEARADLETLSAGSAAPSAAPAKTTGIIETAERLARLSDRVVTLSIAVDTTTAIAAERARLTATFEQRLAEVARRIDTLAAAPSPRQQLEAYIKSNAIFFSNANDYRDADAAERVLSTIARSMLATDAFLRVVGYTDDTGGPARNMPLAQARADKIVSELVTKGVPRNRLVSVGRGALIDLSPAKGQESNNRRVEFELGFTGEGSPAP